jgi:hypothetical protein
MKLYELSTGAVFEIAKTKYRPYYTYYTSFIGKWKINSTDAEFFANDQDYFSKAVYAKWNNQWFYINDINLKRAVENKEDYSFSLPEDQIKPFRPRRTRVWPPTNHDNFVNSYQLIGKEGLRAKETNDCTVVAYSMATPNCTYDRAHELLASAGRKPRKGLRFDMTMHKMVHSPISEYGVIPYQLKKIERRITLNKFVNDNPRGRFIVTTRGHAFAVVNGTVYDHSYKSRRRVISVWEYTGEDK